MSSFTSNSLFDSLVGDAQQSFNTTKMAREKAIPAGTTSPSGMGNPTKAQKPEDKQGNKPVPSPEPVTTPTTPSDKNTTNRKGEPITRKTLCIPHATHVIVQEIAFREEITVKTFYSDAIAELLNDGVTDMGEHDFTNSDHPTVFLSKDLVKDFRQFGHDHKIPERTLIAEATVRHIRRHYVSKYPDIPGIAGI